MKALHQLFQDQVERTPDALAVVDGQHTLTYRELDRTTDALAGYLQVHGVHVDASVGILMEKCADYIIACMAALKAGGAYLPLDMAYPEALLSKILHETQSHVIVTKASHHHRLDPTLSSTILAMDTDTSWQQGCYNSGAVASMHLDNLAYVVYSSGTTGEPKGVLAPHRGAVHSYAERYRLSSYQPGDRVACNVFFVWEFFRPLLKGATIYVIPDDIIYDPTRLINFLSDHHINEVLFTPSLMETVLNAIDAKMLNTALSALKVVWLNGEVVTTRLKHRAIATLPQHVRLLNTYSISECHDVASLDLRESDDLPSGICPVGCAIDGIHIRLLDDQMQPVPTGQVGELYIGGPGVARGYLKKPDLTAERFVELEGERFYRTGDLAFLHANGTIEIRGRCDFMVKIRGYSIHLGAIETALLDHSEVQSCAVMAQGDEGEDKRLVAYIVRHQEAAWNIHPSTGACVALRAWLKSHLPDYMIPSVYVELDAIPINPTTGKLNHKLLPLPPQPYPQQDATEMADRQLADTASKTEQKAAMRTLWEQVLALEPGSLQNGADFFDFGGHSLLAVRLISLIKTTFRTQLAVKDIYDCSTVDKLIDYIDHRIDQPRPPLSIREDADLSPEIVPAATAKPLSLNASKAIFLTGATGFLGAFLLDELLRQTAHNVKLYCLTRVESGEAQAGLNRIIDNLKHYNLWHEDYQPRMIPIVGDLAQKRLGLDDDSFDFLSKEIDFIFHCAALVNFIYPYSILKPHTVDGVQEVLRLAASHTTKPVYYISTTSVFPAGAPTPNVETSDIDAFADQLNSGYDQAKWVAEKRVWQGVSRGLPVCVFRPGNIGHHRLTGAVNPNDFQFHIINACFKVQSAPDQDEWVFELTPVDFLVQSLVRFAQDPVHFGQAYHVVQDHPMSARIFFEYLIKEQHIAQTVPMAQWLAQLQSAATARGDDILSVLAQSLRDIEPSLLHQHVYDCSRFIQAAQSYGMSRPTIDFNYFERLIQRHWASLLSR